MPSRLERLCHDKGLKMTEQRRIIARVLSDSSDHPDVESVHQRAAEIDPRISIATVYRTVRLFEEANILARHDFGDGRSRYEEMPSDHHDHLIDLQTGRVIEFKNEVIERLQRQVLPAAERALGNIGGHGHWQNQSRCDNERDAHGASRRRYKPYRDAGEREDEGGPFCLRVEQNHVHQDGR